MEYQNCWEFKRCGRQPNGSNVHKLGVCPASIEAKVNGIHQGQNGGRCCWVISGTFCDGKVQGVFAAKLRNCIQCNFYQKVVSELGKDQINSMEILSKLK